MPRLMLVDDEPEVVNLLSVILSMYGYEVAGYTDATTALEEAPGVKPDLLLADMVMPGLDGLSLVAAFDRDAQLAGTPVLMLTGLSSGEVTVGGRQQGLGIGILEKPCEPEKIAAEVARLLHEAETIGDYRQHVVEARRSLAFADATGHPDFGLGLPVGPPPAGPTPEEPPRPHAA